jgi:hypothetical protein
VRCHDFAAVVLIQAVRQTLQTVGENCAGSQNSSRRGRAGWPQGHRYSGASSFHGEVHFPATGAAFHGGQSAASLLTASPATIAQTADHPGFDVASGKPNVSGAAGASVRITPGGRLVAQNATLRLLVGSAYDVRDFQLFGGPGWVNSGHYGIEAKASIDTSTEQMISQMITRKSVALITDGRFSGGSHGFLVGHVALVRTGDRIRIDATANEISVDATEREIAARRENWKAPPLKAGRGTLAKYIRLVKSASDGCVIDE